LSNDIKAYLRWQVIPGEGGFSAGAKLQKLTRYLGFADILFKKSRLHIKTGRWHSANIPFFHTRCA
ncbi:MAG: hypothetical protein ACR2K1_11310, partial [Saprospiraceae bacterium]